MYKTKYLFYEVQRDNFYSQYMIDIIILACLKSADQLYNRAVYQLTSKQNTLFLQYRDIFRRTKNHDSPDLCNNNEDSNSNNLPSRLC